LKGALDRQFISSTNELIARFRDLEAMDLWALHEKQRDVDAATRELEALQKQLSDAQAAYPGAQSLDQLRQSVVQKLSTALIEFSRTENREKLSSDGLGVIKELKAQFEGLSRLDSIPLIARPDYNEAKSAACTAGIG
jgi:chromosome segregation ATPase